MSYTMLKDRHLRIVKGEIISWSPANGLVFRQKKNRSSVRVNTTIPASDLVYFIGKVGSEGEIAYLGSALQQTFEVEDVKQTGGSIFTGKTKGTPVTFSIDHLALLHDIKKQRNGKKKKIVDKKAKRKARK